VLAERSHVAGGDAEAVAEGVRSGLLGPGRLWSQHRVGGTPGRPKHEVVAAGGRADLLVLPRNGERGRHGPHSIGGHVRFVLDHVTCRVLLV
jgi:hypothetical protein